MEVINSIEPQVWMNSDIETIIQDDEKLKEVLRLSRELESHCDIGQDLVCMSKVNQIFTAFKRF
jgi:hypothetical protein